jgi:UDP-N-acetylglucosamine 2-epimerase
MLQKLLVIIGTRPEAIKLAPVVAAIERSSWAQCEVVLTGQHKELIELAIIHHFAGGSGILIFANFANKVSHF